MKYIHTNLVAQDWRKLTEFYIKVFNCKPVPPHRDLRGTWLNKALGLKDTHITGVHLELPGYEKGPTLEIFQYNEQENALKRYPNTIGFGHIAFSVSDVKKKSEDIIAMGGSSIGEISEVQIQGFGNLIFAYMRDPEGNIIEIQKKD
jgi:predicted enzyme related to lactoylglutathione lyase